MKRNIVIKILLASLLLASQASQASGIATLTAAISFTDVIAAIMSIGVLVIGVDLATLGYLKVRRLVKGAN